MPPIHPERYIHTLHASHTPWEVYTHPGMSPVYPERYIHPGMPPYTPWEVYTRVCLPYTLRGILPYVCLPYTLSGIPPCICLPCTLRGILPCICLPVYIGRYPSLYMPLLLPVSLLVSTVACRPCYTLWENMGGMRRIEASLSPCFPFHCWASKACPSLTRFTVGLVKRLSWPIGASSLPSRFTVGQFSTFRQHQH